MRLLLISYDFPPAIGGIQTYAFELARRLAERCDDFAVLVSQAPGAETLDATLPFEVFRVRSSFDAFPLRLLPALLTTARGRFDAAFHTQWHTAVAAILARPFGAPPRVFVAAHGRELLLEPFDGPAVLNRGYDLLRGWALRRVDALFPVSRFTASLLRARGVSAACIRVLHNGVDPARFHPLDAAPLRRSLRLDGHRVLLTVSRLVPRKGIDTVLHALPRVLRQVPEALYLIGGSGPDRTRLEALVRTLHLEDHVRFLGRVPSEALPLYYNAGDVFVMPSRPEGPSVEGFGIVFLEASACGKPVVGSRSGGIPDAVRDGETGLLVEPDDPDALAEALIRLLRDDALAARLGRTGLQRVLEAGTWDEAARQLYEAIRRRL